MLNLNMSDVMSVIESCKGYLIALAAVIVLGIVITVLCRKLKYPVRRLARAECWIAVILAVVILMNMICTGPLKGIVSLAASGNGEISEESTEEAFALCEKIAGEGIVLLENNDILPMEPGNINVFGWASSNPCYGGTGSGGLSDKYEKTSLLTGLENAGFNILHPVRNKYWTEEDKVLADMMSDYLVNFMTNGDPNGEGLPQWDPSGKDCTYLEIDTTCTMKTTSEEKIQEALKRYQ